MNFVGATITSRRLSPLFLRRSAALQLTRKKQPSSSPLSFHSLTNASTAAIAATAANTSITSTTRRHLNSFGEQSPLDKFLDPQAPTPLFESTEFVSPPPPKKLECGVDESDLRFKTQCYGRLINAPFVHPNEHRIIMSVPIDSLNLNPLEQEILKEIVGNGRWREDHGELRLQSVSFGSRIENKRHLVSMLDRLVLACQRLAAEVQQQSQEDAVSPAPP